MKKISMLLLILILAFISFSTVSAEISYEVDIDPNEQIPTGNLGVSSEEPVGAGVTGYGIYTPGSSHNVLTQGRITFAGEASGSTLYTNKNFTGVNTYKLQVNNRHSKTLTVKVHKKGLLTNPVVKTYTVSPGKTKYAYPGGLDSKELYFLSFSAPSKFDGYIEY